jgi:hypothetical protein
MFIDKLVADSYKGDLKDEDYFQYMCSELLQLERASMQYVGNAEVDDIIVEAREYFEEVMKDIMKNTSAGCERNHLEDFEGSAGNQQEDGSKELCRQLEAFSDRLVAASVREDTDVEDNFERWNKELKRLAHAATQCPRNTDVENRLLEAVVCMEVLMFGGMEEASSESEDDEEEGDWDELEKQAKHGGVRQQPVPWLDEPD